MTEILGYKDYFADAPLYRAPAGRYASSYNLRDPSDYYAPGLWVADEDQDIKIATPNPKAPVSLALFPSRKLHEARKGFDIKSTEIDKGDAVINHYLVHDDEALVPSETLGDIRGTKTHYARPVHLGALVRFHIPRQEFARDFVLDGSRYVRRPMAVKFSPDERHIRLGNDIKLVRSGSEVFLAQGGVTTRKAPFFEGGRERMIGDQSWHELVGLALQVSRLIGRRDEGLPSLQKGPSFAEQLREATRAPHRAKAPNPYEGLRRDFEYVGDILTNQLVEISETMCRAFRHHYDDIKSRHAYFETHAPQF